MNRSFRPPLAFRSRLLLKFFFVVVASLFTCQCEADPPLARVASVRSIRIKLDESKTTTEIPKKSIPLSGSAGEFAELRCLASLLPLEAGKRVNVRFIIRINGKRTTAAVGFGEIKRSEGDLQELVIPLRLPAKPGLYRLEISQDKALLLAGDFRVVKPSE